MTTHGHCYFTEIIFRAIILPSHTKFIDIIGSSFEVSYLFYNLVQIEIPIVTKYPKHNINHFI